MRFFGQLKGKDSDPRFFFRLHRPRFAARPSRYIFPKTFEEGIREVLRRQPFKFFFQCHSLDLR